MTLGARAFQYRDPEELLSLCYRCSTFNALLLAIDENSNVSYVDKNFSSLLCCLKFCRPLSLNLGIVCDEEAERLIGEPVEDEEEIVKNQLEIGPMKADLFTARLITYNNKTGGSTIKVGRGILISLESSTVIMKWP